MIVHNYFLNSSIISSSDYSGQRFDTQGNHNQDDDSLASRNVDQNKTINKDFKNLFQNLF